MDHSLDLSSSEDSEESVSTISETESQDWEIESSDSDDDVSQTSTATFHQFQQFSTEIKLKILEECLVSDEAIMDFNIPKSINFKVLFTCKLLYMEGLKIFYRNNIFGFTDLSILQRHFLREAPTKEVSPEETGHSTSAMDEEEPQCNPLSFSTKDSIQHVLVLFRNESGPKQNPRLVHETWPEVYARILGQLTSLKSFFVQCFIDLGAASGRFYQCSCRYKLDEIIGPLEHNKELRKFIVNDTITSKTVGGVMRIIRAPDETLNAKIRKVSKKFSPRMQQLLKDI